ncbi:Gfo/Idh/MocA family protein [Amycolatopsis alkalitolerans]|uniref:Gfo/Idh/MocA family oxidoreductase n=1 Tax=Amycolatopsis alkalitolerans TaxID=2547244 RepID=A0A5C4LVI9_9PSEU|nr:Gfo/Idh/MocA family oxidoreductase [Amycolatopsis alkalitolerans]TNC22239.1 Gfo/Idh/MocA family oxidoreductase [Amycolatopsis alkalitolerans]
MTPLRIGIIGCGNIGARIHLPTWLAHPEVAQVVALADPTEVALDSARQLAGLAPEQVHADPVHLIARDDVDVVDICTPQHLRREVLLNSAVSGKHILCEKPLAAVPLDAAAAVDAAEDAGQTLAMVHNYLWLPEIQAAREVIDSGEIGPVRTIVVNYLGVVDVPGAAAYRAGWRHEAVSSGGGVLMDMVHGVYLAETLLGRPVRRVSAYVSSREASATVEDLALCRFETDANAALVNIAWGLGPGGIEVTGELGRVSVRYRDGGTAPWAPVEHVRVHTASGMREVLGPDEREMTGIPQPIMDSFEQVLLDFADAVRTGRPAAAPGRDGLRILEATVGAYKSAVTGELVGIPLDRDDPVFRHGVLGLKKLSLPEWSPARGTSLYSAG